jgi:hypothetical protein
LSQNKYFITQNCLNDINTKKPCQCRTFSLRKKVRQKVRQQRLQSTKVVRREASKRRTSSESGQGLAVSHFRHRSVEAAASVIKRPCQLGADVIEQCSLGRTYFSDISFIFLAYVYPRNRIPTCLPGSLPLILVKILNSRTQLCT